MADLAALQAQRQQLLAEIQRRGGRDQAPGFVKQFEAVSAQIRQLRGGADPAASNQPAIATDYKNPAQAFGDEQKIAEYEADRQIGYNNPNISGPLGGQTVTKNPDGSVRLDQTLAPDQQRILDQDSKLSQMGRELATQRLQQGGLGQGWDPNLGGRQYGASGGPSEFNPNLGGRSINQNSGPEAFNSTFAPRTNLGLGLGNKFNPNLTARTTTGDLVSDRRRIEDQVFQNLTRNLKRDKAEEGAQLEQTLYNRGIAPDPSNPAYQKAMRDFNERYDQREAAAMGQAVEMGGNEFGRTVGIQEQMRTNDFGQQIGTRQQNFGENQQGFANQEQMRNMDFGQRLATHQQGMSDTAQRFGMQEGIRSTDFGQSLATQAQRMSDYGQRFGMQEQQRAADFSQGLAGRQQNFAETAGLAGFGQGVMMPNLPGYAAPNYDLPNPTDVWATYKGVQQNQQQLTLAQRQAAAAQAMAGMGSGGTSGGSSAQQAPNPFNGL